MSGQYPGGYNSPVGGHRGQFNPQQQQQQMVNMNQMVVGGAAVGSMQQNAMGPHGGGMIPMGGGYQGNLMQQQANAMQGGSGGVMGAVMNPGGMHSPSHVQQLSSQQQQQLMQQQQQMQLQQQLAASGAGGGGVGPQMSMPHGTAAGVGHMQQQQHQLASQVTGQQQMTIGTAAPPAGLQQQQQHQQPPTSASNMLTIPQPNTHKEINIVALSRLGQETVQDITSRFQEIFAALKIIQPSANRDNNTEKKVQEYFRTIRLLFKRVRIIYEKCNDGYPQGMEYTHVESLIPYKDDPEHRIEPSLCEEYRKDLQDNQELIETVKLKNRQLREIIDRTRIIIWEINTMLSMRRS